MASPSRTSKLPFQSPIGGGGLDLSHRLKTPSTVNRTANNQSHLSAFTPVQPVFTPSATPRGSSHILLSPSRTITESLNALATSTAQQLESIWDEVGYNPQERASQLSDLIVKFRDQCEQKISEEHGVAETFRQTISDAKQELQSTSEALKAPVDTMLLQENTGQMTLTDELANLEATLEGLRADAATTKQDLKQCQEYLIESHLALGLQLDENWNDIDSDLTLRRRQQFHQKVDEMKQQMTTRTTTIIQLLRDCKHLMNDLGIDAQTTQDPLDRMIAGSLARSKDSSFIMASKFQTESCTGISSKALDDLTNKASQLSGEKRRRKNALQEMGAEIAMLWEQLRIPEEEQRAFSDSVKGLGMDTIDKGKVELKRLSNLKGEMLGTLIAEARETIQELWVETNASEASKYQEFQEIQVVDQTLFDDELLDRHEEYIHTLQDRLEQMKPIMQIIERREIILRERTEYEELQKDSSRLNQRGAAMARQLMEEEKMARRIKKELPKLTKLLQEKLQDWLEQNKEEFQYQGQVYSQVMAKQEEEWLLHKEEEMQLKREKKKQQQGTTENKFTSKNKHKKNQEKKPIKRQPLGTRNRSRLAS